MALVSRQTARQVPIPHEPGQWLKLRRLSHLELDIAREARERKAFQSYTGNIAEVDETTFRRIQAATSGGDAEELRARQRATAEADPLAQYDRSVVLQRGIVAWSYDAELSEDTIADLDEETAHWAARQIVSGFWLSEAERRDSFQDVSPLPVG